MPSIIHDDNIDNINGDDMIKQKTPAAKSYYLTAKCFLQIERHLDVYSIFSNHLRRCGDRNFHEICSFHKFLQNIGPRPASEQLWQLQ